MDKGQTVRGRDLVNGVQYVLGGDMKYGQIYHTAKYIGTKSIELTGWGSVKCLTGMIHHQQGVKYEYLVDKLNAFPWNIHKWYLG